MEIKEDFWRLISVNFKWWNKSARCDNFEEIWSSKLLEKNWLTSKNKYQKNIDRIQGLITFKFFVILQGLTIFWKFKKFKKSKTFLKIILPSYKINNFLKKS